MGWRRVARVIVQRLASKGLPGRPEEKINTRTQKVLQKMFKTRYTRIVSKLLFLRFFSYHLNSHTSCYTDVLTTM